MPSSRTWCRWSNITGCTTGFAASVDQGLRIHIIRAQGIATIVAPAPSTASRKAAFDHGGKTAATGAAQSNDQAALLLPWMCPREAMQCDRPATGVASVKLLMQS